MNYLEMLQTMLANKMQQKFDPRFYELQAELFRMKNLNGPSDTKGQTAREMMEASPRFGDFMYQRHAADKDLMDDLKHPMTPNGMHQLLNLMERNRQQSRMANIMKGGGI